MAVLQKRLIYLRKLHDLKQEDVAQYLGVSRSTYAGYEKESRHYRIPNADVIAKLSDLYRVSADYILGRTPEEQLEQYHPKEAAELIRLISQFPEDKQPLIWKYILSNLKSIEPLLRD
jgi:transcriptional regulator with XRE-family HTH domain